MDRKEVAEGVRFYRKISEKELKTHGKTMFPMKSKAVFLMRKLLPKLKKKMNKRGGYPPLFNVFQINYYSKYSCSFSKDSNSSRMSSASALETILSL